MTSLVTTFKSLTVHPQNQCHSLPAGSDYKQLPATHQIRPAPHHRPDRGETAAAAQRHAQPLARPKNQQTSPPNALQRDPLRRRRSRDPDNACRNFTIRNVRSPNVWRGNAITRPCHRIGAFTGSSDNNPQKPEEIRSKVDTTASQPAGVNVEDCGVKFGNETGL